LGSAPIDVRCEFGETVDRTAIAPQLFKLVWACLLDNLAKPTD
jgi:hypothetical protein